MSQWDTHTYTKQTTPPVTRTTHAHMTQVIHAQVQKSTTHLAQQMLTQSFQHINSLLGQQYQK